MIACFAVLFGWHGGGRGQVAGAVAELGHYVDQGTIELAKAYAAPHPLALALQALVGKIAALGEGESLDLRPADYFYRLLAIDPFAKAAKNENAARNLAIFSQLLNVFQSYYHYANASRTATASTLASTSSTASCGCCTTAASTNTRTQTSPSRRVTCR